MSDFLDFRIESLGDLERVERVGGSGHGGPGWVGTSASVGTVDRRSDASPLNTPLLKT